jgi:hypothetical protein
MIALLFVLTGTSVASAQNGKSNTNQGSTPNGKPFTALNAQIRTFQEQIDALVAGNAAQADLISALGGAVLALEARLAGVEGSVADLKAHDALTDQWIEALEERWLEAEARLDSQASDLQLLFDADQALQTLMHALKVQADNLQDQLAALGGGMSVAQSSLLSDLAAINAKLSALQLELGGKQAALTEACAAGSSIRQVNATTGAVVCELDDIGSGGAGGAVGRLETSDFADVLRTIAAGGAGSSTMFCPSGWVSTGGGYMKDLPENVFLDGPTSSSSSGTGWKAAVDNPGATAAWIKTFTRCARVIP